MWELDHKETWVPKNWCFWTVVLEKTLESPLDCKEFKPVHPKGNEPWIFIKRTDVEAEALILWSPDMKSWLIRKNPDVGKDRRQEEKRMTEGEMVGWHHWLNGHEFEQAPGDGEGQGRLACCSPWGHKEVDMTERLNNNYLYEFKSKVDLSLSLSRCKLYTLVTQTETLFLESQLEQNKYTSTQHCHEVGEQYFSWLLSTDATALPHHYQSLLSRLTPTLAARHNSCGIMRQQRKTRLGL